MGRRGRWIAGGIALVLLGTSVTGLLVNHTFLQGRWDAANATTHLADELERLDGVQSATAVYAPLALPESTVKVAVRFRPGTAASRWGSASALIRSAASTVALKSSMTTAEFTETGTKTTAVVEPLLYTPAVVTSEIAAWRSLRRVVGDRVSLRLTLGSREYTVANSGDMAQVAALWPENPSIAKSSLGTSWLAPGLQSGLTPTPAEMAGVHAVAQVLPLAPAAIQPTLTGTFAVVLNDLRGFKVEIMSFKNGAYTDAPIDDRIVQATRAALGSGAATVEWMTADHDAYLSAGACTSYQDYGTTKQTTLVSTPDSERFAAQLSAAGFTLPDGVKPGMCQ